MREHISRSKGGLRLIWTDTVAIRTVCAALTSLGVRYVVQKRPGGVSIISTRDADMCACPKCGGAGFIATAEEK